MIKLTPTSIRDVVVVEPQRHGDARGFFSEVFRNDAFEQAGIAARFVQDNHSYSQPAGVLRGLHFQTEPSVQGKLVRVTRGAVKDVAVDLRHGSPTFGQHVAETLTAANWRQLWVPPGFAHGFVTLEPDTEVIYKVTGYYDPAADRGLAFDDPALRIDWGMPHENLTLSDKDRRHPRLAGLPAYFSYVDRS